MKLGNIYFSSDIYRIQAQFVCKSATKDKMPDQLPNQIDQYVSTQVFAQTQASETLQQYVWSSAIKRLLLNTSKLPQLIFTRPPKRLAANFLLLLFEILFL